MGRVGVGAVGGGVGGGGGNHHGQAEEDLKGKWTGDYDVSHNCGIEYSVKGMLVFLPLDHSLH